MAKIDCSLDNHPYVVDVYEVRSTGGTGLIINVKSERCPICDRTRIWDTRLNRFVSMQTFIDARQMITGSIRCIRRGDDSE